MPGRNINFNWASPKFRRLKEPHRYKMFWGGRGGGKSVNLCQALLQFALEKKLRILCAREIQNSIKDSVHRLLTDIIYKYDLLDMTKITRESIVTRNGSEFIFKGLHSNIHEIKSLEAIDYCFIEEAQSVSKQSLEILDPTIRKEGSEIWASFNRFMSDDPIWERYCSTSRPGTLVVKINYDDNRFFPEVLKKQMEFDKKNDPDTYNHVWVGDPIKQGENSIIQDFQIQENYLMEKVEVKESINSAGVDVARFGSDSTVITIVKENIVLPQIKIKGWDTVQIADKIEILIPDKNFEIKIDAGNTGSALIDILGHRLYTNVHEINFGSKPENREKYDNAVTEMWFNLLLKLPIIKLPKCKILKEQLVNRRYSYKLKNINSVIREVKTIETKDKYKGRTKKNSPDEADSLVLAIYDCKPKSVFRIRKI